MFTGRDDDIPFGYAETGVVCDDANECHCVIKTGGCHSSHCTASTDGVVKQDGMCIGKFNLKSY